MRLIMALNGVGMLAAAGYAGTVLSRDYTPLWAGIAVFVFVAGLFQPMVAEYLILGGGFKEVEGGFLKDRRRERGLGPAVEILDDHQDTDAFRGRGAKSRIPVVLFMVGIALCALDAAQWWSQRPPPPPKPGVITNF